ncbi:MAG: LynF/TruF/PatF family peptide O-prenyltransferase [Symploca sp. SIO1B1]|nr:LynF/TruF/PatF family peptide O-prenyltransferase [Symploca sp. SIO1B1]
MNQSRDKLLYIGRHKSAFDIDYLYPMDIFEQFVESTGDGLIECSGKIKQDKLYPARFDLQFSDRQYAKNIYASIDFLKRVATRVDVSLDLNLLEQFLGNDFDFSKVQTVLVGVDLRHELHESRLKLFIRIGDYPEKVTLAKKLCGDSPQLQQLLRYDTLHIGFDFNLDGRSAIELYPEVKKEEFKQPEVYQKLTEILSLAALKPLAISNLMGIGFSQANEAKVLYYHLENIRDFLNYFPINNVARRVHDFYLQQDGSKKMWVALSEAELIAGKINNVNLYYSKAFF